VIDLQSLARSAAFAWLANGRLTVGLDDPREGATAFYDLAVPRPSASTHAVDWYLSVLPVLGVPVSREFQWLPPRSKVAATLAHSWPIASARWILLQPGARWLNKRWPVESFAALARQCLTLGSGFRVAVLGAEEDGPLAKAIATTERCLDLTGKLSLPEMVEWMRFSELVITNDTGPMHVAAALGKPAVALFGPTDPRRTGPYGQLDHVVRLNLSCVPCLSSRCRYAKPFECLRALPVNVVFEAVKERLNGVQ
jgi:lipopolysaccharide heptosyltransferase II